MRTAVRRDRHRTKIRMGTRAGVNLFRHPVPVTRSNVVQRSGQNAYVWEIGPVCGYARIDILGSMSHRRGNHRNRKPPGRIPGTESVINPYIIGKVSYMEVL